MPRTAPVCARCKMPLAFVAAAVLTAGVSGRKQWGNLFMDFAFMGGALSHDQDRFVNDNLAERASRPPVPASTAGSSARRRAYR